MSETKISEPLGCQSAEVLEWSKSLRSRSPSPSRHLIGSRSPSPLQSSSRLHTSRLASAMMEVPKPTLSQGPKSSTSKSTTKLRKSDSSLRNSTGNVANKLTNTSKSMNATKTMTGGAGSAESIEAEYIKNLQQQIYFLELETNYLREQAQKATDLHPKMTAEAERMLLKLRQMQSEMDGMQLEMQRKDSSVTYVNTEKAKLEERLQIEEEARARDKRMLMDEIVELKRTITKLEGENSYKDNQLFDARNELEKSATALKNAETKILTLKSQFEQRVEQHKMTQINLDEKRSELVSMEVQLKEMEEKYYSSTISIQDKVTNDMREEIRTLRQRQKEAEMSAEQERHLRAKMTDDSSEIVRENASLNQQLIEYQRQLDRERHLREENESRHSTKLSEMVQVKEKDKELNFELEYVKEQLKKEQERSQQLKEQVSFKESMKTQQDLQLNTARSRVTELSCVHESLEKETIQLRKDKTLLVEHVSDLQRKLEVKNEEVVNLRTQVITLEQRMLEIDQLSSMDSTSQSQKWGEFEKLAESMRTLSHSMARSTASPRSITNVRSQSSLN